MQSETPSTINLVKQDSGIEICCDATISEEISCDDASPEDSSKCSVAPTSSDDVTEPMTWWRKLWPPRGQLAKWFTWLCILCGFFGALWALAPESFKPGESEFGLVVTLLCCFAAEALFVKIPTPKGFPSLPPLLASLLMGLALNNLPPPLNIASYIEPEVGHILREIALTIILTEAGLEIDPEAMMKVKWAVCRLAFLPCIGETTIIGILAHFILGFPFIWSFMLGFVIAAVSPAVVVPSLILIQDAGLGVSKGIPSLVMAASGIDDVLAIAGFTILLGIAIPSGIESEVEDPLLKASSLTNTADIMNTEPTVETQLNVGKEIGGAILEIVIGIVSGIFFGFFVSTFPANDMKFKNFGRGFLLLSIGILYVFGTHVWGIPGAGSLCALIMSFVASIRWGKEREPLGHAWHYMWKVFQPILFGLTGALVNFSEMDGKSVGLGLAVLGCALIVRLTISTLVTFGLKFNVKERIFVSISWIPKGTVQAALGSVALDQALLMNRPDDEVAMGEIILWLAVLITLITAPIGAFAISLSGPRLLSVSDHVASSSGEDNFSFTGDKNEKELENVHSKKQLPCGDAFVKLNGFGLNGITENTLDNGNKLIVTENGTEMSTVL